MKNRLESRGRDSESTGFRGGQSEVIAWFLLSTLDVCEMCAQSYSGRDFIIPEHNGLKVLSKR